MSLTSLKPPKHGSSLCGYDEKSLGHVLLRLVRLAEKSDESCNELATLLQKLSETFLRRGLLGGDDEKADSILASGIKMTNFGSTNKRDKKKNAKSNHTDVDNPEAQTSGACDDVNLLLSALVRIAGGNQELSAPRNSMLSQHLIVGGFHVVIAVLQHLLSRPQQDSCALAEFELLGGVARSLLTGVVRTLQAVDNAAVAVAAFRVATLLVTLFGARLSRNQTILSSLRSLAWTVIVSTDESIQREVGAFLAALPLTGLDKSTPSTLWSSGIVDGIAAIFLVLETVVPLKTKALKSLDAQKAHSYLSDPMKEILTNWTEQLKEEVVGANRQSRFTALVSALTFYVVSLFEAQFLIAQESTVTSAAQLAMDEIMDLLDSMLSFPSVAESLFYGTKKRLRFEVVDGGLLSPHEICESANHIKHGGLDILASMVQSVGRPVLLPFGKRVVKLAHSALLSACSVPLRHALDPTTSLRTDGKRKKWLHMATELKTKAIQTFGSIICAMGSNALVSPLATGARRGKTKQADKGVALIVGSLLELQSSSDIMKDSWGSTKELVALTVAAIESISTVLTECGGFLSFSTRTLIDSSVKSCLEKQSGRSSDVVFSSSPVKTASLNLAATCVMTPWPDGAATSLVDSVRAFARHMAVDVDESVAVQAKSCLQTIRAMNTPRAPPLLFVTRSSTERSTSRQDDAETVVERLQAVQETLKTKDPVEATSSKKSKRKKEKHADETDSGKTKRAKLEVQRPVEQTGEPDKVITDTKDEAPTLTDDTPVEPTASRIDVQTTEKVKEVAQIEEVDDDDEELDFMPGIVDDGPDDDE